MPDEQLGPSTVAASIGQHNLEVVLLPADARTAPAAAAALNTSVGSIVKSLLFIAGGVPSLVLASGDRKVNPGLLAARLGVERVRLARPDEVLAVTGYAVGGVPPVAHRQPLDVLMDRRLLDYPLVYAAAGDPRAVFGASPEQIRTISGAEISDITD